MTEFNHDNEGEVKTIRKDKLKRPRRFKVLLHNDDYTTMEFVVLVLQRFFSKNVDDAHMTMMKIHREGIAICGVYTYEIAESKATAVTNFAKDNGHPLLCTVEPE